MTWVTMTITVLIFGAGIFLCGALIWSCYRDIRMKWDADYATAQRVRWQCDEYDRTGLLPGERLEPTPAPYDGIRRIDLD